MLIHIVLTGLVLFLLAAGCFGMLRLSAGRRRRTGDGRACLEGACGDRLEFEVMVRDGRITGCRLRTNGCAHSLMCLEAAARLARGRTPADIRQIDADRILKTLGGLPEEHRHCAILATTALHAAVDDFLKRQTGQETAHACIPEKSSCSSARRGGASIGPPPD